jgi:hypothetical protein
MFKTKKTSQICIKEDFFFEEINQSGMKVKSTKPAI